MYDQKPVKLGDSMRQRLRWVRGQTQVSLKYIPRLLAAVMRFWWKGDLGQAARAFDAVMWVPNHFAAVILLPAPYASTTALCSVPSYPIASGPAGLRR